MSVVAICFQFLAIKFTWVFSIFSLPFSGLVGFSNAVNLTDGIDGLASISVVISLSAYGVIAYMQNQLDILLVILAMIGGLLGFFVFNHKPAKVFMEMWEVWLLVGCWQQSLWLSTKNGPFC